MSVPDERTSVCSSDKHAHKSLTDFVIQKSIRLSDTYALLVLRECGGQTVDWNHICPGQFVEIQIVADSMALRRPISIHDIDSANHTITLLVRVAGRQTATLCDMPSGVVLNVMLPLGNGFNLAAAGESPLLVGGGVGVAPLLLLGKCLKSNGIRPTFLLAAKSATELLRIEEFRNVGNVLISTDDGSAGVAGLITENPALHSDVWSHIYCCGPMPMMKAVAAIALAGRISCEVSLENSMACGLGACLCCVENTVDAGNVCVCTDGPVFDINRLNWFS